MDLLLDLTVIFSIAALVLFVSAKLNIPTVVGLLLSGLIAGPYGLGLVNAQEEVEVMAEIGILLLMFTIGMEFSLEKLTKSKKWILAGGGLQVFLTILVVLGLGMMIGLPFRQALFISFLFAMSSTAIVLHILQEKGKMDTAHGKASLSVLIFQDIIIIPMMLVVPFIAGQAEGGGAGLWLKLGKGVLIVSGVVVLAIYLVPKILHQIVHTQNQELFLMSILVICFATAFITYELGLKLALGAFLAGLIISESEYSYDALSKILPLKKIFTGIFFISVGMLLNTKFLAGNLFLLLALTAGVLLLKTVLITLIGVGLKLSLRNALITGLALCQVGEFAFVLSKTGNEFNLLTIDQYQTFLAVSILSMAVSPFIIYAAPRWANRFIRLGWGGRLSAALERRLAGQKADPCALENHLVIIGFGINGQQLAHTAAAHQLPYSIIELNEKTVDTFRAEGEPIYAGDARDEEVLAKAAAEKAKTVVVAIPDPCATEAITKKVRKMNHHAYIIVRTRFVSEIETLQQLGANEVIPEEFEASLRIFERTMTQFESTKKAGEQVHDFRMKLYGS